MYLVVEIQKYDSGNIGNIVTVKQTRAEAESTYHSVLASAALSSLPVHGAILMDEHAVPIMRDCYIRETDIPNEDVI